MALLIVATVGASIPWRSLRAEFALSIQLGEEDDAPAEREQDDDREEKEERREAEEKLIDSDFLGMAFSSGIEGFAITAWREAGCRAYSNPPQDIVVPPPKS